MSGRVNDVHAVVFPETGGRRRLNRDAAFLLLLHEVGSSSAVMNLTGFVDFSGQFKNSLGSGGFTGIYVGENTDVAVMG